MAVELGKGVISGVTTATSDTDIAYKEYADNKPGYALTTTINDGDFYKVAHGGQGLYISPTKDLVIAFYGTANTDRERNQLLIISRELAKSGLFDLE